MYRTEKRAIFTAPAERIFEKDKPTFSRKSNALQVMGESEADSDGLMFPGDENEETEERLPPEEIEANPEQEDSRMVSFEVKDEVHQTKEVQTQNDYSDSWLANVRYSPDRPRVCFEFAGYVNALKGRNVSIPTTLMTWQGTKLQKCWDEMVLRILEKQQSTGKLCKDSYGLTSKGFFARCAFNPETPSRSRNILIEAS